MDFEPFHSDEDEECASIMPEKKKKDGKKSKGGPLFHKEKKANYSDHVSTGIKGKHSVHGVVGPAEYTFNDQASLSSSDPLPVSQVVNQPATVATAANTPGRGVGMPSSVTISPKSVAPNALRQAAHMPKQNTLPDKHTQHQQPPPQLQQQQQQHVHTGHSNNTFTRMNSSPASVSFTPKFPPMAATQPIKIDRDRPHVSPAVIPDTGTGPLPFKQPVQNPSQGKQTLLSQAITVSQYHPQVMGQQSPVQVTASNDMYVRSQTFDSTVVAPSKPIPIPSLSNTVPGNIPSSDFHANYEAVADRGGGAVHEYSELPGDTTRLQHQSSNSSHSASPFSTDVQPENIWPDQGVGQDFVDSAEWAQFNPSISTNSPYDGDLNEHRRKSQGTDSLSESIPESIGSSVESEFEDSVWKINNEQRDYYTKQFKKIQPNISEVIKGPQARDFFLKSNLPNETLSMIWQLSDMDKDAALNLTEFCIAMHLVVAVKHGVELPTVLPFTLFGSLSEEHLVPMSEEVQPVIEESDVDEDEEIRNSSMSEEASLPSSVDAPMSNLTEQVRRSSMQDILQDRGRSESFGVEGVPISPIADKVNGAPNFNTPLKEVTSTQAAIARPRASAQKNVVNLMDSAPWQLLPPPSTKGKPQVKKTLNMDDESSFMSNDSFDQRNSFSSTEQLPRSRHDFDNRRESFNDNDKSNDKNLSKEKSRSIDSLRQEMMDDYSHVEMRRISQGSRPRSYSGESPQFNGTSSKRISKEIEIPPPPPPRHEGHKRSSSHDFNSIPNSIVPPPSARDGTGVLDQKPHKQTTPSPHRVPQPTTASAEASKQSVRFSDHLDVADDGSVATFIDKKVRKHELQSRIRMLKDNNVTLSNLVAQLHTEWKSASEERIALDVLLQKERQGLS